VPTTASAPFFRKTLRVIDICRSPGYWLLALGF
jgi:23S rRNA U2552 (ribose-2'-O)-methylase RlmE/FtsJ